MFKSKYIFETKKTRFSRYLKSFFAIVFGLFILYSICCWAFILVSQDENKHTESALFKRPPDLIVVFTGDLGRIPYAVKKSQEYKQTHIFITGVYSKNTVNTLLKAHNITNSLNAEHLEIDYLATNTIENVISTLRYLKKNKGIERILVISHDYHIMRIKKIFNVLRRANDNYQFFYSGIETNYQKFRNIKILYKEVFKLIKTYTVLLFWDTESSYDDNLES